jgi:segregation and condensation protein B
MLLKNIVEAALFAAPKPLNLSEFVGLFPEGEEPNQDEIREVLAQLEFDYRERPIELREVASGFRFQVRSELSPWISRLFEERPARYSKAFLETLAIIAYRQPVTRGEIEEIRGVAVSTQIIRGLMEREWVHVVGHKEVPGRPALYASTPRFLDSFNLKALTDLPPLKEFLDRELPADPAENITSSDPEIHHGESKATEPEGESGEATAH